MTETPSVLDINPIPSRGDSSSPRNSFSQEAFGFGKESFDKFLTGTLASAKSLFAPSDLQFPGLDWGKQALQDVASKPLSSFDELPTEKAKVSQVTDAKSGEKRDKLHLTLKEPADIVQPDKSTLHFAKEGSGHFEVKESDAAREIKLSEIKGLHATASPDSYSNYLGKKAILEAKFTHDKGADPKDERDDVLWACSYSASSLRFYEKHK